MLVPVWSLLEADQHSNFLLREAEQQEYFHEGEVDEGVISSHRDGTSVQTSAVTNHDFYLLQDETNKATVSSKYVNETQINPQKVRKTL